jgi:hypothetical protein
MTDAERIAELEAALKGRQADLDRAMKRAVEIVRDCYEAKLADLQRKLDERREVVKYRIDLIHTYPTSENPKGEPVQDIWTFHDDRGDGTIERIREKVAKLNQVVKVLSVRPLKRD